MRSLAFDDFLKHPTAVRLVELDFFPLVANFWRPGEQYTASDVVRPRAPTGFAYTAGGNGQSGLVEPAWPTTLSDTVVDGGVTWTAGAAGGNGVTALSAPAVVVDPTGELTLGSPSVIDGMGTSSAVTFTLTGGVAGKEYRVEVQATAGAETVRGSMRVIVSIK